MMRQSVSAAACRSAPSWACHLPRNGFQPLLPSAKSAASSVLSPRVTDVLELGLGGPGAQADGAADRPAAADVGAASHRSGKHHVAAVAG